MTYGTQVSLAERLARVSPNAVTLATASDVTRMYLNQGMLEFAKRAKGIPIEDRVAITPRFDIETNYAVKFQTLGSKNAIASTTIYLTPTAMTGASGSSVASYLQAMLNTAVVAGLGSGSITVNWSASSWQFYVACGSTATSVYFGGVTNDNRAVSAEEMVGLDGTEATSTFTGALPTDCTMKASMPSGYLEMLYVEWDNEPLAPAPYVNFMSPESTGTPTHYAVANKEMRLYPTPDEQGKCVIRYKGFPAEISTDGTDDSTTCALPEETHMAPVYYAAAMILEETHEPQQSVYFQQKFNSLVTDYKIREANQTPTLFPQVATEAAPKVVMDES